ncbi:MAG: bifunctional tetrahydrofolate synthase/dihydrofolate synthase [Gammaproteobacteria bacterium]|nr:MAG: bifunctional tetrahydrofolate synthase/dihydrofolate synthase [Gammaproteobacteria bacterium]
MRFHNLSEWLAWQEKLHFTEIDPGLERVEQVYRRLIPKSIAFTIITVAGTNGKGSSVQMLESILRAAGYKTGSYTSPHLMRYNERICVNGIPCSDETICQAFEAIDTVREDISLTYFEFGTLAAINIFKQQNVDIVIMEVGMGGRLDATNLLDADIALITPISIDHTAWLGNNREEIAYEKAGILRSQHPLVCSEKTPPNSVLVKAADLSVPVYKAGDAFSWNEDGQSWSWHNDNYQWDHLPKPALEGRYQLQNSAAVLQVVSLLTQKGFEITRAAVETGLRQVKLLGRFQRYPGKIEHIFDVTHNAQGAENLAELLAEIPASGKTIAVLAMLKDKDVASVVKPLNNLISQWYVGGIKGLRGMSAETLSHQIEEVTTTEVYQYQTVSQAFKAAMQVASEGDRLLIFGSFHTVGEVMKLDLDLG